jgi:hypothetical protein
VAPERAARARHTPSLALRLALGFALAFASTALLVVGVQALLAERFGHLVTRMSMQGQTEDIFDGFVLDAEKRVVGVALEPDDSVCSTVRGRSWPAARRTGGPCWPAAT